MSITNQQWWQFGETAAFLVPGVGPIASGGLALMGPMFGMADSGVSMAQLLQSTVNSINAWTTKAINQALNLHELQDNFLEVTTRIAEFQETIAEFNAPTDPSLTMAQILQHYQNGQAKLNSMFQTGSDLDIALGKLTLPDLAESGLPTYMDGATFSIMISALNIALARRIYICQVQLDAKTTDAEKQKLLAWPIPDPTIIMTHLNKTNDYIQHAGSVLVGIMQKWYTFPTFSDSPRVDVNNIRGLPFPLSQDADRVTVQFGDPSLGSPWFSMYKNSDFSAQFLDDFIRDQIAANYGSVATGLRSMQAQQLSWYNYLVAQLKATGNTATAPPILPSPKSEPQRPFPPFPNFLKTYDWTEYPLPFGGGGLVQNPTSLGTGAPTMGVMLHAGLGGLNAVLGLDATGSKAIVGRDGGYVWSMLFLPGSTISGLFVLLHRQTNKVLRWLPADPNHPDPQNPTGIDVVPFDPVVTFSDQTCQFQRIGTAPFWIQSLLPLQTTMTSAEFAGMFITTAGYRYDPGDTKVSDTITVLAGDSSTGVVTFKQQSVAISGIGPSTTLYPWIVDSSGVGPAGQTMIGLTWK